MEYDLREIRKSKFLWKVYSAMVNHLSKRAVILTLKLKLLRHWFRFAKKCNSKIDKKLKFKNVYTVVIS